MEPDRKGIVLTVEYDWRLLNHVLGEGGEGGVPAWNRLVRRLIEKGLTPPSWAADEEPAPLGVLLDFRRLRMPRHRLHGIFLGPPCDLTEACLDQAAIRDSIIGDCPRASFRGARMRGTRMVGDISGADFTDAEADGLVLDESTYDPSCPPKGLPPDLLARSRTGDGRVVTPDGRRLSVTATPVGFVEVPTRCHASICIVPIEG